MICFNSTQLERELSLSLGIPLWAADPDLLHWGTKSGSRQIFAECDLPHPDGSELVWNADDLAEATVELWGRKPQLQRVVIKLNEGFSGEGNAILDLRPLQDLTIGERLKAVGDNYSRMNFQGPGENWDKFSSRIGELKKISVVLRSC